MTIGILPNVNPISPEAGCKFGDKCSFAQRKVEGQPSKKPKRDGDKSAVAFWKDVRQLGFVFQDKEPPESLSILRMSPRVLGSIRRVRATQRHANIRENNGPSLGKNQVKVPHQRSPYALKFEDMSQEETERQERCARILKLKEKDKATFFSPTNDGVPPAQSVTKPEKRKFVVDSGASMHMLSREDLNSAELETVRVLKSPTTVVTAKKRSDRECQRIGCIRDSNASRRYTGRSLTGKTLRRSRIFLRVDQWSETTTHQRWQTDKMQHGELCTDRCPWFIDKLFKSSYTYISNFRIAGSSSSYIATRINKKREYELHSMGKPVA